MRGIQTSNKIVQEIKKLRSEGDSILEISKIVGKSKSIVSKYVKDIKILPQYEYLLKEKQGGSKSRSLKEWKDSEIKSKKIINTLSSKEKLLILACLYWGEGTKTELNIINSDPEMLRVFIISLKELGIDNSKIKATIRIYEDLKDNDIINFWSKAIDLPKECFKGINLLKGKKVGKLKHGMCRIRVEKSKDYFKLIMSIIERIKDLSL
ncbi:MAG: hypothetical protein NT068_03325 [Candidatus Nomurabacteria bacterium]|nr:hypothetical protein [Candidatus Nomurabacteria bacterium]